MLEGIRKLGLNEYEARAYKAILSMSRGTAVGVSKKAGIPRARIYDVLFSLEKKGFAVKSVSKPVEFSPLRPSKVVSFLAKVKKQELDSSIKELEAIAQTIEKSAAPDSKQPQESVLFVEGRKNIYALISQKLDTCSGSIVISSSVKGMERKKHFFGEKLEALSRKGVKLQVFPSSGARFVVFDKDAVMLFLNNDDAEESSEKAVLLHSPPIVQHFLGARDK